MSSQSTTEITWVDGIRESIDKVENPDIFELPWIGTRPGAGNGGFGRDVNILLQLTLLQRPGASQNGKPAP